jgi:hypothetical protein
MAEKEKNRGCTVGQKRRSRWQGEQLSRRVTEGWEKSSRWYVEQ